MLPFMHNSVYNKRYMQVNTPNFFIIGAPRSGTTSLSEYLQHSPDIFFSKHKEPKFFDTDLKHPSRLRNIEDYLRIHFAGAEKYKARGEGTVWYLYSTKAVKNIVNINPHARFIVVLRNPVDMVYSLHQHLLLYDNEDIINFDIAWNMQSVRRSGEHIPPHCYAVEKLLYGEIGKYGAQLHRLFNQVPRKQILILFFEDFVHSPAKTCAAVSTFLDIRPPTPTTYPAFNTSRQNRSLFLKNLLRKLQRNPRLYRNRTISQTVHMLIQWNQKHYTRPPLDPTFKKELTEHFKEDILLLEELMDHNLTHWKT